MTRIIEDIQGTGSVATDGTPIVVAYALQVVEDDSGLRQVLGRIDVLGTWTLIYNIFAIETTTTLHLADGRRLDFMITAEGEATGSAYIRGLSDL